MSHFKAEMSHFKAEIHHIRFWLRLRPIPHWGSLQCTPDPHSEI